MRNNIILHTLTHVHGRWKDEKTGALKYTTFIPDVERPVTDQDVQLPDPSPGEKRKRVPRRATDKGALYHDYNASVHEWLTHIRRVHWKNPAINIAGKTVKAADALAPPGTPMYYVHSKTNMYNKVFFDWFVNCFAKTFALVCPFYDYQSVHDLEKLLDAEVER